MRLALEEFEGTFSMRLFRLAEPVLFDGCYLFNAICSIGAGSRSLGSVDLLCPAHSLSHIQSLGSVHSLYSALLIGFYLLVPQCIQLHSLYPIRFILFIRLYQLVRVPPLVLSLCNLQPASLAVQDSWKETHLALPARFGHVCVSICCQNGFVRPLGQTANHDSSSSTENTHKIRDQRSKCKVLNLFNLEFNSFEHNENSILNSTFETQRFESRVLNPTFRT